MTEGRLLLGALVGVLGVGACVALALARWALVGRAGCGEILAAGLLLAGLLWWAARAPIGRGGRW